MQYQNLFHFLNKFHFSFKYVAGNLKLEMVYAHEESEEVR